MNKKEIVRILFGIVLMIVLIITGMHILKDSLIKMGYKSFIKTEKDYIKAAQYHMKKKYGDEFESEYYYDGSIYSHPVNHPDWKVIIDVEIEKGKVYFHDNYVGFLKKAELESYIYELIKPIYGECKVYTRPYGFPLDDSWNKDTDIMTYAYSGDYATHIFTYDRIENKDEDLKKTCDIFMENTLESNVINVTYLTQNYFESFEEKSIDYTYNSYKYFYSLATIYNKRTGAGFSEVNILKGKEEYGE